MPPPPTMAADPYNQLVPPQHYSSPPTHAPIHHGTVASPLKLETQTPQTFSPIQHTPGRGRRRKEPVEPPTPTAAIMPNPNVIPVRDVNIKTKFPVARIKRIMQADEDVGKVAQVTPVIVSKALEMFMVALCDKAADQARQRNSKRITAGHLKKAIAIEEKFDFLAEIIAKIPDAPSAPENPPSAATNSNDDEPEPPKKTRRPRGSGRAKKEESL